MKCMMCGGEMDRSQVTYTIDRKGYHLFIEKIPAYVCVRCGERFFDEKEVSGIQEMIEVFEKNLQKIQKAS